jgi:hypothetical protein
MVPDPRFSGLPGDFWAYVRLVSEGLGYSLRKTRNQSSTLRTYTAEQVEGWLRSRDALDGYAKRAQIAGETYLVRVLDYLNFRAAALENTAPALMDREEARKVFRDLKRRLKPKCLLPLNKQKGEKRHEAYLTCIVNMLTEEALGGCCFDQSPGALTTIRRGKRLVRTLSRRFDGAYPSTANPVALGEVKEYYGTTTFGSRVADGVYETMLDGYELADLRENEKLYVKHYLIVDDRFIWWEMGKSYLCRIVDALHMGLVDQVLFGRETLVEWPRIVRSWPGP